MSAGLDNEGDFWVWGGKRTLSESFPQEDVDEHSLQPILFDWFSKNSLKVQKFACGEFHVVVKASDQEGKSYLYCLLDLNADRRPEIATVEYLTGCKELEAACDGFVHKLDIDADTIVDFSCNRYSTVFIMSEKRADSDKQGILHFVKQG